MPVLDQRIRRGVVNLRVCTLHEKAYRVINRLVLMSFILLLAIQTGALSSSLEFLALLLQ